MIILIKNIKLYAPEYLGVKDVAVVGDKIHAIGDDLKLGDSNFLDIKTIDGTGKILVPGFIDGHVHLIGGGGEGGFKSRTPEIKLTDITTAGVTTIVGCLGTDGIARNMMALLAKAKGLKEEGISAFIYTGSYQVPVTTISGEITKDIMSIEEIIGVGEIALSDHRSSQPSLDELKRLISQARVGGVLSDKAGLVNMHVGDGKAGIRPLVEIMENTEIPLTQVLPTHMNRNEDLFLQGVDYAKAGGFIDFTTSSDPTFFDEGEVKCSKGIKRCYQAGVDDENITLSSDGQGSLPIFNDKGEYMGLGVGRVSSLFDEVRDAVLEENLPLERVLKSITSNPAKLLKLKGKGSIKKDYDADLVLLDEEELVIDTVIAKGQIMVENKETLVFGTFDK